MCDIMYVKKKASWASRLVIGFNFKTRKKKKKKSGYSLASFIDISAAHLQLLRESDLLVLFYCRGHETRASKRAFLSGVFL